VARHRRCLAAHRELLDPAHAITLRRMREEQAEIPVLDTAVDDRDLGDYDRAFGVA
jgi:hypothetical protein